MSQFRKVVFALFFALLTVAAFAQNDDRGGDGTNTNTEVKDPNPATGGSGVPPRATGGPDAFGNTWDDSVPYQEIDITGTGTMVMSGDDVSSGAIALGGMGTFNFYGQSVSSLNMASNGYITTDGTDTGPDLSNDCPLPSTPSTGGGARMYPYHDDLISDGYYQYFSSCPRASDLGGDLGCHVFMWDNVTHFGGGGPWQMWAVLYEHTWESVFMIGSGEPEEGAGATMGIQNEAATDGLTYACDTGGAIPNGTAVAFYNPEGMLPCTVDNMSVAGFTLTIEADCDAPGFDIWAMDVNGGWTLVEAGVVLDGVDTFDVSNYPDSFFYAFTSGADPGVDTPLAFTFSHTVPTLGQWGLIAFLSLLAVAGLIIMRKRTALS